ALDRLNGRPVELDLHLGCDLDRDQGIAERDDPAVEPAVEHHLIVPLDRRDDRLLLLAAPLLGTQDEKVEDRDHEDDGRKAQDRRGARPPAGLRPGGAHATPTPRRPRWPAPGTSPLPGRRGSPASAAGRSAGCAASRAAPPASPSPAPD